MKRRTVNLTDEEDRLLGPYFDQSSPQNHALAARAAEEAPLYSDSAVLRALALEGAKAIEDQLMAAGYRELAASYGEMDLAIADESLAVIAEMWDDE